MKSVSFKYANYRAGGAYFICDTCSQRRRRYDMLTQWDGMKVCPICIDPRPPQMIAPNIYPEGIPFLDPRAPQDNPDRLTDETHIYAVHGGEGITQGGEYTYPNGMKAGPGALSPRNITEDNPPQNVNTVADDVTIRTGPVAAPNSNGSVI